MTETDDSADRLFARRLAEAFAAVASAGRYRHRPSPCVDCGEILDVARKAPRQPRPGDFAVCLYCGHLQAFGDDMRTRNLTDEEMGDVAGDPGLLAVSDWAGELRKRFRGKR